MLLYQLSSDAFFPSALTLRTHTNVRYSKGNGLVYVSICSKTGGTSKCSNSKVTSLLTGSEGCVQEPRRKYKGKGSMKNLV